MDEAFSQFALCGPSRTSLLTSRLPQAMQVMANRNLNWRRNKKTRHVYSLPQYFKDHGYRTKSIGKIFHPIGRHGHQPDDYPYSWTDKPFFVDPSELLNISCPMYDGRDGVNLLCAVNSVGLQLPDMKIKDEALNFLSTLGKTERFFLGVGFHKPHVPFHIPGHYLDRHDLKNFGHWGPLNRTADLPNVAWNPWMDLKKRDDIKKLDIHFPFGTMPSDYAKYIRHHYYAAVTYVDEMIGQVLHSLVENGHGDNTIVTLIGDHGWMLGENQEWSKYSNYKAATRVPWLLHIPEDCQGRSKLSQLFTVRNKVEDIIIKNHPRHRIIKRPVQLLDLFPTLVDKAGLPPLKKCKKHLPTMEKVCTEGKSLFDEEEEESLAAFWQYPRPSLYPSRDSDQPRVANFMGYSVLNPPFRLTKWVKFNRTSMKAEWDDIKAIELYDHSQDPGESRNVALDHPRVVEDLSVDLQEHFQ